MSGEAPNPGNAQAPDLDKAAEAGGSAPPERASGRGRSARRAAQRAEQAERAERPKGSGGDRIQRTRERMRAFGRGAFALISTVLVLAFFAGVTDVVLHEVRHTDTSSVTYSGVRAVDIVLDGDISINVLGRGTVGGDAQLTTADTSTPFDDPDRTIVVIGGTLYLTERCPDSFCTAQLNLVVNPTTSVRINAGNGLRLGSSVIEVDGITGGTAVLADPAKLIVNSSMVTGAVIGTVDCDTTEDCAGVVTPPSTHG